MDLNSTRTAANTITPAAETPKPKYGERLLNYYAKNADKWDDEHKDPLKLAQHAYSKAKDRDAMDYDTWSAYHGISDFVEKAPTIAATRKEEADWKASQPESRGSLATVGTALGRGAMDFVSMAGGALSVLDGDPTAVDTHENLFDTIGGKMSNWADTTREKSQALRTTKEEESYADTPGFFEGGGLRGLKNELLHGAESVTLSAGTAALGAGIGLAAAPVLGVGAGAAAVVGGLASLGAIFFGGTYDKEFTEQKDKIRAVNPDASEQEIIGKTKALAAEKAGWEAGSEVLSDLVSGAIVLGTGGLGAPAAGAIKTGVKGLLKPGLKTFLKRTAVGAVATVPSESGTEMLSAAMQDKAMADAGLEHVGTGKAAVSALIPSLVPSIFFGVGGASIGKIKASKLLKDINSEDIEARAGAVNEIAAGINQNTKDKELATSWLRIANQHIIEGKTIDVNEDIAAFAAANTRTEAAAEGNPIEPTLTPEEMAEYAPSMLQQEEAPLSPAESLLTDGVKTTPEDVLMGTDAPSVISDQEMQASSPAVGNMQYAQEQGLQQPEADLDTQWQSAIEARDVAAQDRMLAVEWEAGERLRTARNTIAQVDAKKGRAKKKDLEAKRQAQQEVKQIVAQYPNLETMLADPTRSMVPTTEEARAAAGTLPPAPEVLPPMDKQSAAKIAQLEKRITNIEGIPAEKRGAKRNAQLENYKMELATLRNAAQPLPIMEGDYGQANANGNAVGGLDGPGAGQGDFWQVGAVSEVVPGGVSTGVQPDVAAANFEQGQPTLAEVTSHVDGIHDRLVADGVLTQDEVDQIRTLDVDDPDYVISSRRQELITASHVRAAQQRTYARTVGRILKGGGIHPGLLISQHGNDGAQWLRSRFGLNIIGKGGNALDVWAQILTEEVPEADIRGESDRLYSLLREEWPTLKKINDDYRDYTAALREDIKTARTALDEREAYRQGNLSPAPDSAVAPPSAVDEWATSARVVDQPLATNPVVDQDVGDVIGTAAKAAIKKPSGVGTNQRRAAAGGELGANGEWYEGGKFIANTDAAKGQKKWKKPTGRVEVDKGEWTERPAVESADNVFLQPLLGVLGGKELRNADGSFSLNPNLSGELATPEAIERRTARVDAWNKGARWFPVAVDANGQRTVLQDFRDKDGKSLFDISKADRPSAETVTVPVQAEASTPTVKESLSVEQGNGSLESAMRKSTRKASWGETDDVVAQGILAMPRMKAGIAKAEEAARRHGADQFQPMSGGASSVVIDAGPVVVRIMDQDVVKRIDSPNILQPLESGVNWEVLPKADTANITEKEVAEMKATLAAEGLDFHDPGTDQLGRVNGKMMVLDPGSVRKAKAPVEAQSKPDQEQRTQERPSTGILGQSQPQTWREVGAIVDLLNKEGGMRLSPKAAKDISNRLGISERDTKAAFNVFMGDIDGPSRAVPNINIPEELSGKSKPDQEASAAKPPVGAGMRKATKAGAARVAEAKKAMATIVNDPDIVGKDRADRIESARNLVNFLETNAANDLDTGYEFGDKVAYTGEDAPEGMRAFIYLEGAKAGKTGVAATNEARDARATKAQDDWQKQQEEFGRLKEDGKTEAPDNNEAKRQMLADMIATRKANGEPVKQDLLNKLAELEGRIDEAKAKQGYVASATVYGHPEATNNETHANLIPIIVKDAATIDRAIDRTQKEIDALQRKLGEADAIVKGRIKTATKPQIKAAKEYLASTKSMEDETALEMLRTETMPELSRLAKLFPEEQAPKPDAEQAKDFARANIENARNAYKRWNEIRDGHTKDERKERREASRYIRDTLAATGIEPTADDIATRFSMPKAEAENLLQFDGRDSWKHSGPARLGVGPHADKVLSVLGLVKDGELKGLLGEAKKETVEKKSAAPAKPQSILDSQADAINNARAGKIDLEEFKASFTEIVENEQAVKAELNALKKDQLLYMLPSMTAYRMKSEKKAVIVDAVYESGTRVFALGRSYGPSSFVMSGPESIRKHAQVKLAALKELVANTTEDDIKAYSEQFKQDREELKAQVAARRAAIENPKTLDDFREFISFHVKNESKSVEEARLMLSPEQRAEFDRLLSAESMSKRKGDKDAARTSVSAAGQQTGGEIIATKHTQKGHDLFVVRLEDRVSREDYMTLLAGAKKLGGYYSKFRGNGAIPGFQFTEREQAQAFLALAKGDTATAQEAVKERRDAFEDDRSQTAAQRLLTMAERLEEQSEEILGADRKANTARRARQAANAEDHARGLAALGKTMRNLAKALEDGTAQLLSRVRQKTQVEMLGADLRTAKNEELRAKYPTYAEQEKHRGEPPTMETADYALFPKYTLYRSDWAALGRQLLEHDGFKTLGKRIMSVADDVTDAYIKFAKENRLRVSAFSKQGGGLAVYASKPEAERAIQRSGYRGQAIVLPLNRGENYIILSPSEAMKRGIWQGDGDAKVTLKGDFVDELIEKLGGRKAKRETGITVPWQLETAHKKRKTLARMGIEAAYEYRAALREFLSLAVAPAKADKIKELERSMVGRANDGLDFFPTPQAIADEMVMVAEIEPGMSVLEPSAGMGHIAERIREAGAEPDVAEMSSGRRELLEAKGFYAVGSDFMDMNPRGFTYGDVFRDKDGVEGIMRGSGGMGSGRVGFIPLGKDERQMEWKDREDLEGVRKTGANSGYDRIVMNPPFSNRRDVEHVRRAYDLLKPGGRLVAIMGEGSFFGQDKKAQEFRDWLDSVGGTSEKLPEGSFQDPTLPVNTGVNARMVVIEKDASAQYQVATTNQTTIQSIAQRQLDAYSAMESAIDAPDGMDVDTWTQLSDDMDVARKELVAKLAEVGKPVVIPTGYGAMFVHPSSKPGVAWQATRLDKKGEPFGDTAYKSAAEAFRDVIGEASPQDVVDAFNGNTKQYATTTTPSPVDLRAAFPWADSIEEVDGRTVITKGKVSFTIEQVETISANEVAFRASYGRSRNANEQIAGEFLPGKATIRLSKVADQWTVMHEYEHFLEDMGLITPFERGVLDAAIKRAEKDGTLKFDPGTGKDRMKPSELRAYYVQHELAARDFQRKTTLGRVLQKVADFIDALANLFARTSKGVVRDVASGKMMTRPTAEQRKFMLPMLQAAYHGTPYRGIEKFLLDKIGTGEGAQAYGFGLYFTSKKEIADFYRKNLSNPNRGGWTVAGDYDPNAGENLGQLYKVDLPDDTSMLHWDKALDAQPAGPKRALTKAISTIRAMGGEIADNPKGNEIYFALEKALGSDKAASESLNTLGVVGIKYLDGISRGAGDGTYNFVIFDENAIEILETYYQVAKVAERGIDLKDGIVWSPERLDLEIRYSAYPHGMSKAMVAWVNPASFLKANTTGAAQQARIEGETGDIDLDALRANDQTPFLYVDQQEDGTLKISGHEGRHRLHALAKAGVGRVPIVLDFRGVAVRERAESLRLESEFPSRLPMMAFDAIPLTKENREEILATMYRNTRAIDPSTVAQYALAPTLQKAREFKDDLLTRPEVFGPLNFINTQLHKALKQPAFRRVFDRFHAAAGTQQRAAARAASLAPDILPDHSGNFKQSVRELFTKTRDFSIGDLKHVSRVMSMETLSGKDASPFSGHRLTGDELTRLEAGETVTVGGNEISMNAKQMKLYRQSRAALDQMLTEMATSEAWRIIRGVLTKHQSAAGEFDARDYWEVFADQPNEAGAAMQDMLQRELEKGQARLTQAEMNAHAIAGADDMEGFKAYGKTLTKLNKAIDNKEKFSKKQLEDGDLDEVIAKREERIEKLADELGIDASDAEEKLKEYKGALKEYNDASQHVENVNGAFKQIEDVFNKSDQLIKAGYAPLSRFGKYRIDVLDDEGKLIHASFYDSSTEAARERRNLVRAFDGYGGGANVGAVEPVSQEDWRQFQGANPEALRMFAQKAGAESEEVMQAYYQNAISSRSALKRLINRQGYAGYSEDLQRIMASFITSGSKRVGSNYHAADIAEMVNDKALPADLRDEARKLKQFIDNPGDAGSGFRSFAANWYMLGSMMSAAWNGTQVFTSTTPELYKHGGSVVGAFGEVLKGYRSLIRKGADLSVTEKAALKRAMEDGTVDAAEIHHLYAQATKRFVHRLGDGEASKRVGAFLRLWGMPFSWFEVMNRKASFIAAYRMGEAQGADDAYAFAKQIVDITQGIYAKHNRPNMARGAVMGSVMTFMQYKIMTLEQIARNAKEGGQARKAAALQLAIIAAMGGWKALPGVEDITDLYDTIMQAIFGQAVLSKKSMREAIEKKSVEAAGLVLEKEAAEAVGQFFASAVNNGIVTAALPVDVAGRASMGGLIPGLKLLKPSTQYRDSIVFDMAGVPGSMIDSLIDASGMILQGDMGRAAMRLAPNAVAAAMKGVDIGLTGEIRNTRGKKITDGSPLDAALQTLGAQPKEKSRINNRLRENQELKFLTQSTEKSIVAEWADAYEKKGVVAQREALIAVRKRIADWNSANPNWPIVVKQSQVMNELKNRKKTTVQLASKSAPKELRQSMAVD